MSTTIPPTPFIASIACLLLASCSSPPVPPTVDASQRRPVNSPLAVELQVCKHDLQNTRILASESGRQAETAAAKLANLIARQQVLAAMQPPGDQQQVSGPQTNTIYTVWFEFGSTRVVIPPDMATALIADAKSAPLVMLRGRTDGTSDAPAESHIARDRTASVRDYLVANGVDPIRVRATYQPAGDHVADNVSAEGRGLNRRVEIELYRALPVALRTNTAAQP